MNKKQYHQYIHTSQKREKRIDVRTTLEEKAQIKKLAEIEGMSVSDYMLNCALSDRVSGILEDSGRKAKLADQIILQERVNQFVDYVRYRLGEFDWQLNNEIKRLYGG